MDKMDMKKSIQQIEKSLVGYKEKVSKYLKSFSKKGNK